VIKLWQCDELNARTAAALDFRAFVR